MLRKSAKSEDRNPKKAPQRTLASSGSAAPKSLWLFPAQGQFYPGALGPSLLTTEGCGSLPLVPPFASLPILPLPSASFHQTCPSPACSSRNERRHNPPSTHFSTFPQPGAPSPPTKARLPLRATHNSRCPPSLRPLQSGSIPTTALEVLLPRSLSAPCGHNRFHPSDLPAAFAPEHPAALQEHHHEKAVRVALRSSHSGTKRS